MKQAVLDARPQASKAQAVVKEAETEKAADDAQRSEQAQPKAEPQEQPKPMKQAVLDARPHASKAPGRARRARRVPWSPTSCARRRLPLLGS